ncbi:MULTISPECIES: benzoate/H(+) symporter BenE family transporter [unclassified Undibacterium]|uniref:benzoate/H(+) symporter BenE family transporter n=1 Tax=unclassified Undibacterium TaxID=2630295 RepID=UPI002AC89A61|nr:MULTISPECIES: benzoate/H(+) symporter BenE family transporter [unclassified Undibacterium]MEB0137689.1 benzoate/H(+) symporter BenE family transporter [Undibacterium sp. CCC2.1]MEB0172659.1 benzoate/H(+) symporter BenE family transporter [Undibacterium sp. CCC1.1]MEB0177592.1 benzoate/H(+) symporter BenE family transporter [Undibacterium sp. CCC3.4]MEB0215454.1 benzoate/H(+) symporter BenE family transporter [Undibacterium sp. 5I2]WPX42263.1 benzoate/H(+) symporter BenE family transporter [
MKTLAPLRTSSAPSRRLQSSDLFAPLLAGFIAVLVSYAGPMLLMLQAGAAAQLSATAINSWIWAVSIGSGIGCIWLSWRYRCPVICAWNTPGAALLVTALASVSYGEAIGAYMLAAAGMMFIGMSGLFEKIMLLLPKSLCAAMLAGILFRFGTDIFGNLHGQGEPAAWLTAAMFVAYLLAKRYSARYAILITLVVGVALYWLSENGDSSTSLAHVQGGLSMPLWTTPVFSLKAMLSLGLPLLLLGLSGQQMPGIAVLRAAGYEQVPLSPLVSSTGLLSLLLAPFGSHGINLAAITAAICTGPEAHAQVEKRWLAGIACGLLYLLIGSFSGSLTALFWRLPHALVSTVAGLALLGAIQSGLVNALANVEEREAALITFIVTASNLTLFGLGSACWGIAIGCLSHYLLRRISK